MKRYVVKIYVGVDVYIHVFLTSALSGGEWSASRVICFTPGKQPQYAMDRRMEGPQNRSGLQGEEKNPPYRDSNSDLSAIQHVARVSTY
jgi:hypothetical protein